MPGLAALLTVMALLCVASEAEGRVYYVSTDGSDANRGTSAAHPWRTIRRVNRAHLRPHDRVLFRGTDTFADATLIPPRSGLPAKPIGFGSYGRGKARLRKGIWTARSHLVFRRLDIDGGGRVNGVAASARHAVANILIKELTIRDVGIGIIAPRPTHTGWVISDSRITDTGDSGIIIQGTGFLVEGNVIADTGGNPEIEYNKHGIYAKGPDVRIVGNRISRFEANGISTRYQNAEIVGNRILGGPIGVAHFQDAPSGATTRIVSNRISQVSTAGVYLDGSTLESFVIASNSIKTAGGIGLSLKQVPDLTVANNLVTGSPRFALEAKRPAGSYAEHHNLWHSEKGTPMFRWEGQDHSLEGYRAASGQGAEDRVVADPGLTAGFFPRPGSPAIDAGTVDVSPLLAYRQLCRPWPLDFCGAAPEMGALEYIEPG